MRCGNVADNGDFSRGPAFAHRELLPNFFFDQFGYRCLPDLPMRDYSTRHPDFFSKLGLGEAV